jgi:hypothetical protein
MKDIVYIDGKEEEVEIKPITLFYGYSYKLDVPNSIKIDCSRSLELAQQFTEEDIIWASKSQVFRVCFDVVFRDPNITQPKTLAEFQGQGSGVKAVFVLIMRMINVIVEHGEAWSRGLLKIDVRHPETCLHPREQANLADLFIKLQPGGFRQVQEEIDLDD